MTAKIQTPKNPVAVAVINKLQAAQGWSVKGDTAVSTLGTNVRFTEKTAVVSNGSFKKTVQLNEVKGVVAIVVEAEKQAKAKKAPATTTPPAEQAKPKKENTMPATTTTTIPENKKAATKPAAKPAAKPETKPETKPAIQVVMPANPTPGKTPVFDEIKGAAEKTEKATEVIKQTWKAIGERFEFKVSNLTKALLAEGLWPAAKDAKGNLKHEDIDGQAIAIPAGYQAVYKAEKEAGEKGIGYYVNVAAASFGRHNMETAEKKEKKTAGPGVTPGQETLTEKEVNKLLLQLEKAAQRLSASDLKSWLETSKTIQPVLDGIIAEREALSALDN